MVIVEDSRNQIGKHKNINAYLQSVGLRVIRRSLIVGDYVIANRQNISIDTKMDMESSKIMDRLICGDVGYGKTEIAIRAAFKAAVDGKQTAVLVPTTILASGWVITNNIMKGMERRKFFP